jgi:hypothetical protein
VNLRQAGRHLFQASEVLEELAELSSLATLTRLDHDTAFVQGVTSAALAAIVLLAELFVVVATLPWAEEVTGVSGFVAAVAIAGCVRSAVSHGRVARRKDLEWKALQQKHQARVTAGHRELREAALALQGRGA